MEKMHLTQNDYNELANNIMSKIDIIWPYPQNFDIDLIKNNKCFCMSFQFTIDEIMCYNIETWDFDTNTIIQSDFDVTKLDNCLYYDVW